MMKFCLPFILAVAASPADATNAGLENTGKPRQSHPNTKPLGKYRLTTGRFRANIKTP